VEGRADGPGGACPGGTGIDSSRYLGASAEYVQAEGWAPGSPMKGLFLEQRPPVAILLSSRNFHGSQFPKKSKVQIDKRELRDPRTTVVHMVVHESPQCSCGLVGSPPLLGAKANTNIKISSRYSLSMEETLLSFNKTIYTNRVGRSGFPTSRQLLHKGSR